MAFKICAVIWEVKNSAAVIDFLNYITLKCISRHIKVISIRKCQTVFSSIQEYFCEGFFLVEKKKWKAGYRMNRQNWSPEQIRQSLTCVDAEQWMRDERRRACVFCMCKFSCARSREPKKGGLECVNACVSWFLTVDQWYWTLWFSLF